jgi:predicted permease
MIGFNIQHDPGPLVLVAVLYEIIGILMALLIRQVFWVPHRFRHGILVAGGWGNVGDIRK